MARTKYATGTERCPYCATLLKYNPTKTKNSRYKFYYFDCLNCEAEIRSNLSIDNPDFIELMVAEQKIEIIQNYIMDRSSHWKKTKNTTPVNGKTHHSLMLELQRNTAEMEELKTKFFLTRLQKEEAISNIYRNLLNKAMDNFSELRQRESDFLEEHGQFLLDSRLIKEKSVIEINKFAMSLLREYVNSHQLAQDPLVAEPRKKIVFMENISATVQEKENGQHCIHVDYLTKKDMKYLRFIGEYLFENDYIAEDNDSLITQFAFAFLLDEIRTAVGKTDVNK